LTVAELRAPEGVRILNEPGQAVAKPWLPPVAEEGGRRWAAPAAWACRSPSRRSLTEAQCRMKKRLRGGRRGASVEEARASEKPREVGQVTERSAPRGVARGAAGGPAEWSSGWETRGGVNRDTTRHKRGAAGSRRPPQSKRSRVPGGAKRARRVVAVGRDWAWPEGVCLIKPPRVQ